MNKKNRRGFTAIELLIVIVIISIVAMPFMYMEVGVTRVVQSDLNRMELSESAALAMDYIGADFRGAEKTMGEFRGEPARGRLILAKAGGGGVIYTLEQGRLVRLEYASLQGDAGPSQTAPLAANVVEFQALAGKDDKLLNVRLALSRSGLGLDDNYELNSTFARRLP